VHEPADDTLTTLWRQSLESLIAEGATPAEAIDGANIVVEAYERQREEEVRNRDGEPPR
jgi:hypothetical protein